MGRGFAKILLVCLGSIAAGWLIGALQDFVAVNVALCGVSLSGNCRVGMAEFYAALWQGGLIGAAFGLPTGLVAWYILGGRSSAGQIVAILAGTLLGGCTMGAVISFTSAFFTPLVALLVAAFVRNRQ